MEKKEPEGDILLIHPCKDDPTKVTAEIKLAKGPLKYDYFDSCALCQKLSEEKLLDELKCSVKLGLAKFNLGSKSITIFKNGRVVIRRAEDKEDVAKTIKEIKDLVKVSLICQSCGKLVNECECNR